MQLSTAAAELEIGQDATCIAHLDPDGRIRRILPGPKGAMTAPPLWYAELREPAARPPAVALVAFCGGGVAVGSLLDAAQLRDVGVASEDQVGAVRWWPATGEVDQIYVQPQWRRMSVASCLIRAAAVAGDLNGWARLWGDGQRTELGEDFVQASRWRDRAQDLTHIAPPMTPS